jgi:ABC-2 type transport system ATP-binding protein
VLCSHNLAEVERLCTRVAVIKNTLRTVAPVKDLKREGLSLEVKVQGSGEGFVAGLLALPFAPKVLCEGSLLRVMLQSEEQAPDVIAALVGAGARIYGATRAARPLEEAYLELVREKEGS